MLKRLASVSIYKAVMGKAKCETISTTGVLSLDSLDSVSPPQFSMGGVKLGLSWAWPRETLRQGKGCRSQGQLAVAKFFVHLPPQSRHILLAEDERLSQGQTLAVL